MKKCKECGQSEEYVTFRGKSKICNVCRANEELEEKYGYQESGLIPAGLAEYY